MTKFSAARLSIPKPDDPFDPVARVDLRVDSSNVRGVTNVTNAILRLPEVKTRTGLSRSTIYLRVAEGTFPEPIKLGDRAVGWVESEVEDWLRQLIVASRKRRRPAGGHE